MIELQNHLDIRLAKLNRGEMPKEQIVKDLRASGLIDKAGKILNLTGQKNDKTTIRNKERA